MARTKPGLVKLDAVKAGKSAVERKSAPDPKDNAESADLDNQKKLASVEALNQENKDKETNRDLRKEYANKVYFYLCGYSGVCAVVLLLSGWKIFGFELPATVLSLLVGSTAVAAIGLVGFVVNGLFKTQK
jgi:hypothetical protein